MYLPFKDRRERRIVKRGRRWLPQLWFCFLFSSAFIKAVVDGYSKLPNGDGSVSPTGTAGTLRRQVYKWIRNAATTIQVCNPVCQNQQTNTRTVVVEKYGPIEDWDVSKVTHMAGVFYGVNDLRYFQSFNADISKWNVGAVHNMKNSKCSLNFIKYKHPLFCFN